MKDVGSIFFFIQVFFKYEQMGIKNIKPDDNSLRRKPHIINQNLPGKIHNGNDPRYDVNKG